MVELGLPVTDTVPVVMSVVTGLVVRPAVLSDTPTVVTTVVCSAFGVVGALVDVSAGELSDTGLVVGPMVLSATTVVFSEDRIGELVSGVVGAPVTDSVEVSVTGLVVAPAVLSTTVVFSEDPVDRLVLDAVVASEVCSVVEVSALSPLVLPGAGELVPLVAESMIYTISQGMD